MKTLRLILIILSASLFMNACSKDDNEPKPKDDKLELADTKWQILEINFTSGVKPWTNGTYSEISKVFGWAPFMYSGVYGMDFSNESYTDAATKKSGKIFHFKTSMSGGHRAADAMTFWVWNALDNGKTFEVKQLNASMPPHDFSMTKATDVKIESSNGMRKMRFTTTLTSLDQDKINPNSDIPAPRMQATAVFTVEEVKEFNNKKPALKLNGQPFTLPKMMPKP